MTSTTASPDSGIDGSTEVPSDPWSGDWDAPTRGELEARHESVQRHQREGRIPSRQIRRVNRRVSTDVDRRADAEVDRRDDPRVDRRADAEVDRRGGTQADEEWIATYWRDRDDESLPTV